MKTWLILSMALALWPVSGRTQTPGPAAQAMGELKAVLDLKGDPARGKPAFVECSACHRKDASGRPNGSVPRLAGQHASVIAKQIVDIRSGLRNNPAMKPVVTDPDMTLQGIADIAAYLQSLPIGSSQAKGPGSGVARGMALYARDCAGCHGPNGEGRAERFQPMVAAQHYGYLLNELGLIRDGSRGNSDSEMQRLIRAYGADDLQAVADYMAQLPPPAR
jgi:cytochrome c553